MALVPMTKEDKIKKKIQDDHQGFYDMVMSMNSEELKKEMSLLGNYREETELAKANDEEIKELKYRLSEANAPYNDTLKVLKLKMAFLHLSLKELDG